MWLTIQESLDLNQHLPKALHSPAFCLTKELYINVTRRSCISVSAPELGSGTSEQGHMGQQDTLPLPRQRNALIKHRSRGASPPFQLAQATGAFSDLITHLRRVSTSPVMAFVLWAPERRRHLAWASAGYLAARNAGRAGDGVMGRVIAKAGEHAMETNRPTRDEAQG